MHSHKSGVDAFMTGCCFAHYCLGRGGGSSDRVSDSHFKSASWLGELEGVRNKLALSGKTIFPFKFARVILQKCHKILMICCSHCHWYSHSKHSVVVQ